MNPIVPKAKYEELAAQYEQMPHYTIDAFGTIGFIKKLPALPIFFGSGSFALRLSEI